MAAATMRTKNRTHQSGATMILPIIFMAFISQRPPVARYGKRSTSPSQATVNW